MSTVRDIIRDAMLNIGVVASGEVVTSDQAQDALRVLNRMVSNWSLERLMLFTVAPLEFPLVAGKSSYTLGTGGDFDAPRPIKIDSALIRFSTGNLPVEYEIKMLNLQQWNEIPIKKLGSTIVSAIFDTGDFPLRVINVYPVPSVGQTLILNTYSRLNEFATIDDEVSLPAGYETALVNNLAVQLAPQYGREAPQTVASIAIDAKADLKRINTDPVYLECDYALLGRGHSNTRARFYRGF